MLTQGISNVGTYLALSLPLLLGPETYIGDLLTMLLALGGVAISAATSAMESMMHIFAGVLSAAQGLWEFLSVAMGAGGEVVSEAAGIVAEGVQVGWHSEMIKS